MVDSWLVSSWRSPVFRACGQRATALLCPSLTRTSFIHQRHSMVCVKASLQRKNIAAIVLDRPLKPFIFTTLGQLATIGRRKGVVMVFGIKFSGFVAWVFWRTVYLMKLPRLPKKLRVVVGWTLDLFFARDIEQMITLRDVEALSDMAGRIRGRATTQMNANLITVMK